mgnify:FL=1
MIRILLDFYTNVVNFDTFEDDLYDCFWFFTFEGRFIHWTDFIHMRVQQPWWFFIFKNGIQNSIKVQTLMPWSQKKNWLLSSSKKFNYFSVFLFKNWVFVSLIILSMLLVECREIANRDEYCESCEDSRGFTFFMKWQMPVQGWIW